MEQPRLLTGVGPRDIGLLIVRVGVGFSVLTFHGWGKLTGGPDVWVPIGKTMHLLGIGFAPVFWGFMAGFAEGVCSALIALGVLFRPAAALLAFNMFVAMLRHLTLPADAPGAGLRGASHALELFSVYVGLCFTGSGRLALWPGWRRGERVPKKLQ